MRPLLLVVAVGCGSSQTAPSEQPSSKPPERTQAPTVTGAPRSANPLDEMAAYTKRMCACKDRACTDKVHDDRSAWEAGVVKSGYQPDPANWERSNEVLSRYEKCMIAILSTLDMTAAGLVEWRTRICDCRDQACGATVHGDFKKAAQGTSAPDPARTKHVTDYVECLAIWSKMNLRGAPAP